MPNECLLETMSATQGIVSAIKRHSSKVIGLASLAFSLSTQAQDVGIAGTWLLERATDFDNLVSRPTTNLPPTLQILGDRFVMPTGCTVQLLSQPLAMDRIFQNLLKADASKADIESFYQKQYKLGVREVKTSLRSDPKTAACYRDVVYLLQRGDTLVASEGGGRFSFLYKRAPVAVASGSASPYTQLPFQLEDYEKLCLKGIEWADRKPFKGTTSCSPLYYPQIAVANSSDVVARLVGRHNYQGPAVGLRGSLTNDYSNPVESGFRPVYQVFAPKGAITLVHVTDLQGSSSRDAMPGAYLSILNGKVVSQLNSNCTLGLDYACRELNSAVYYTLSSAGEFVQHDR